jgi:alpha-N-arabinofuranosidase
MMREAGSMIDGLDMHYYTLVGNWTSKGSATAFGEREWFVAMKKARRVDEYITRHASIMDKYDPAKRVALIVGEWGMWHDVEPGTNPGFLYQQNTMRDALVASTSLDIFNRHADRVRGANIAQMVNVLQAMLLTKGPQLVLTSTYHVVALYTVHQDAVRLPLALMDPGQYTFGGASVVAVTASASRDRAGVVHPTMSNVDATRPREVSIELRGLSASRVTGRVLTAQAITSYTSFDRPDDMKPAPFSGARLARGRLTVTLPPHVLVVLTVQ